MLIVIVIIGILAAALIPRLSSARGRANDVARKADLSQVAAALVAYQIDHGSFPTNDWSLVNIKDELIKAWMSSIPTDPNSSRSFYGIWGAEIISGQYWYTPIEKSWIPGNGFVVMAAAETEWWANRVASSSYGEIDDTRDYSQIVPCKTFQEWSINNNSWSCSYQKWEDQLRYIYVY